MQETIEVIKIKGEEYFLIPKKHYNKDLINSANDKEEVCKVIDALSIGEYEAAKAIFENVKDTNSIINLSKIANKNNMTKTLVNGTLKKLKIAGVIDTAQRGPQGTDLTIKNKELLKMLKED